ncbi:MAG TPA: hypothetical protein VIG29_22845, partial [Vicinamibacteria bacterium]
MNGPATEAGHLTDTLLFCRALRERGLAVTPSEAIDAVRTLNLVGLDDRQEVFFGLRCVLTSRVEDYPVFEELFEDFWGRIARDPQPRKLVEREAVSSAKQQARVSSRERAQKGLAFFLDHWGSDRSDDLEGI